MVSRPASCGCSACAASSRRVASLPAAGRRRHAYGHAADGEAALPVLRHPGHHHGGAGRPARHRWRTAPGPAGVAFVPQPTGPAPEPVELRPSNRAGVRSYAHAGALKIDVRRPRLACRTRVQARGGTPPGHVGRPRAHVWYVKYRRVGSAARGAARNPERTLLDEPRRSPGTRVRSGSRRRHCTTERSRLDRSRSARVSGASAESLGTAPSTRCPPRATPMSICCAA